MMAVQQSALSVFLSGLLLLALGGVYIFFTDRLIRLQMRFLRSRWTPYLIRGSGSLVMGLGLALVVVSSLLAAGVL